MKPRLLVLTPRFPYPLYGGDVLRIYRLCEALKGSFRLTLISMCQTQSEMDAQLPDDSPFETVHKVYHPKWRSMANAFWALGTGNSMQVAYYASGAFQALVTDLRDDYPYLLCHLARTAPYAAGFQGVKILELTDHIPLTYARSNALDGKFLSLRRLAYTLEQGRIDAFQNDIHDGFDLISFVSDVDRQMFLESSGASPDKVVTFGNGVDLNERPFQRDRVGKKIAFIGTLNSMPNADAVSYFLSDILPIIRRSEPEAVLKVVGKVDDGFKSRFENQAVEFTGAVADLAKAVSDCVIGICPMRIGAGVQNKMLDYMAMGLPVITTQIGAEGLDPAAFVVASTSSDFANETLSLLEDKSRRFELADAGREIVDNGYSWDARLGNLASRIMAAS